MNTMQLRFLTVILTLLSFVGSASAKINIEFIDGFIMGEVTKEGVNIRSGAGTQFPIATYPDKDYWTGKTVKTQVPQAYKGQNFWVKEANVDWYEIYPVDTYPGATKQFISKQFVKIIETEPFDIASITEPQVWADAEAISYGDEGDFDEMQATIVTILPGGLAITQYYSPEEDALSIGNIDKEGTAIFNRRTAMMGYPDATPAPDSPLNITPQSIGDLIQLTVSCGENKFKKGKVNGREFSYMDLTEIPIEKWVEIYKALQTIDTEDYTRNHYKNFGAYLTRDDLEKNYTRLK